MLTCGLLLGGALAWGVVLGGVLACGVLLGGVLAWGLLGGALAGGTVEMVAGVRWEPAVRSGAPAPGSSSGAIRRRWN